MIEGLNFILFSVLLLYLVISVLLFTVNRLLVPRAIDLAEKNSPYECGFDPFTSIRERTSIHFYLVSILFLIFDIEITLMFPWAISLVYMGSSACIGYNSMILFLFILTVGFAYEWLNEALSW